MVILYRMHVSEFTVTTVELHWQSTFVIFLQPNVMSL